MAVSCFYSALLHLRVLCFDSCFLSCLAPRSAFTVLHHLNSHIIVVNVGAQSNMWNVDLASGPIRGAWHARQTLRPFMTHSPGSPSTGDGLIGLDGVMVSFLLKPSDDPMPKTSIMEVTSGRCHGSLVSSLAYSGRAPAGQDAVFFWSALCMGERGRVWAGV